MPLPSQLCLLGSLSIYPALTYVLNRRHSASEPSLQRYAKVNKLLSTIHSSLITILALHALQQQEWRVPQSTLPDRKTNKVSPSSLRNQANEDDTGNPFITTRSEFANSITALETGYLIQDTFALLIQHYLLKDPRLEKVLLLHHVGIGSALSVLQYYIAHGRETGIYVIVMFLLMNGSTPLLNLRWYLRKFRPRTTKHVIFGVDLAFAVAFFASRVYLVWAILAYYGKYHGRGALESYWRLRTPCKIGTGALWMAMTGWWLELVRSVITKAQNVV